MVAMPRHALGLILLIVVTAIWGSTFAVVKTATETLAPATLVAWRFTLAVLTLLPLFGLGLGRGKPNDPQSGQDKWGQVKLGRAFWRDSLILGLWLVAGYATQTLALGVTSANRAAFLTGLNVVMVPLWLALTGGRKPGVRLWGAVLLAALGIALLSWEGGAPNVGDAWAFGCALSYTGYILALERAAPRWPPLAFAGSQVLAVTLLSWLWAALSGAASWPPPGSWGVLLYLGVAATAVTTLLQTLGQRWVGATEAAVIYALEPVAASAFSFVLLGEAVGRRGLLGGALVVAAMLLSQLPGRRGRRSAAKGRGLAE